MLAAATFIVVNAPSKLSASLLAPTVVSRFSRSPLLTFSLRYCSAPRLAFEQAASRGLSPLSLHSMRASADTASGSTDWLP